jgi:hypothetical protein
MSSSSLAPLSFLPLSTKGPAVLTGASRPQVPHNSVQNKQLHPFGQALLYVFSGVIQREIEEAVNNARCVQQCLSLINTVLLLLLLLLPPEFLYSFDQLSHTSRAAQVAAAPACFFQGGGWTDCVLLLDDDSLRVMENSRRDTLVLERVV